MRVQVGVQALLKNERQRIPQDISGAGVYDERRAESVKIMEDSSAETSLTHLSYWISQFLALSRASRVRRFHLPKMVGILQFLLVGGPKILQKSLRSAAFASKMYVHFRVVLGVGSGKGPGRHGSPMMLGAGLAGAV